MPLNSYWNTLFIEETIFKQLTGVNDNTDMKVITPTIKLAQDKYLPRILGDNLLTDLQNKINLGTLSSNETLFLQQYVQPALTWAIMMELPPYLTYRYMNKGIEKKNSDNSTPVDLTELKYLVDKAKNNFDYYAQRVMDFLCANPTLFSAYRQENESDEKYPSTRGYRTTWFLGTCENDSPYRRRYR